MSTKWRGLTGPITAENAEAEPEEQRLFGPSYEAQRREYRVIDRAKCRPWKKPVIERQKEEHAHDPHAQERRRS